jgi:hypothetical protein
MLPVVINMVIRHCQAEVRQRGKEWLIVLNGLRVFSRGVSHLLMSLVAEGLLFSDNYRVDR